MVEQIIPLEKQIAQLRAALANWRDMFEWGDFTIDFSNGNTHYGIDEGEASGIAMLEDFIKATEQALADTAGEEE